MTYLERLEQLKRASHEELLGMVLNDEYNDFVGQHADWKDGEDESFGKGGKRVPYVGWYWRHVDWKDLEHIPIGDCGDFVGFMIRNKWDYPQRYLTRIEALDVIQIVDVAQAAWNRGGLLSDLCKARDAELKKLWDYMQTLTVER